MDIIANINEAATYATVGAVLGVTVYHNIGGGGLAIAGGAYGIGLGTFATGGAVAGLAVYGVKKSVLW
ncbi:hypothetical protein BC008_24055 [Mastigocoleus testarum BC008]|uniref:Bacteriocin n=2 Tax=Mastigocoleus TaxID=996924 RepID=A0A0V7ZNX0_9CYAN|nr:hypothetical protein BC008_42305 [Mastigocoleus testarum BC008]KST66055.1 hypothetical protein BC008_24055 [Mastigocoleus testarum BC008]